MTAKEPITQPSTAGVAGIRPDRRGRAKSASACSARCVLFATPFVMIAGCAAPQIAAPQRPNVAPAIQPAGEQVLMLDRSQVQPMYQQRLLAIDLPTVVSVAKADNFDILQAREQVEVSSGALESSVGAAFPVIVPTALFDWVDGPTPTLP